MLLFVFLNFLLIFLIAAAIAHILDPILELVLLIGIETKEARAEIETHPVLVELKIRKQPI